MKLRYEAQIVNEDTDEVLVKVSGYSMESLEEELYKLEKVEGKHQDYHLPGGQEIKDLLDRLTIIN